MTDVTPRLKEDAYGECGCGCGVVGRLKKPWRSNGVRCVAILCECKQCKGGKSNRAGKSKQRTVAKRLGLAYSSIATGHEENYVGPVRTEVKSSPRAAGVVETAYERERAQSDAAKSVGDIRPFMASYAPKGSRHSYHVVRDDDLEAVAVALCAAWGLLGEAS